MEIKELKKLINNFELSRDNYDKALKERYGKLGYHCNFKNTPEGQALFNEVENRRNDLKNVINCFACQDYGDEYCLCITGLKKVLGVLEEID